MHLTYAEYARHGFFELVAAAVLVLPLLLGVHALVRGRPERRARWSARCRPALIVLVLVVMASALQRMLLYQREYGLTELRIYTTGVMLWLGVVFVWLGVTVLRGRPRAFAAGAVVAGFAATLALNVVNPDALIARTNLVAAARRRRLPRQPERRRRPAAARPPPVARSAAAPRRWPSRCSSATSAEGGLLALERLALATPRRSRRAPSRAPGVRREPQP